jgi:hypothetical protein
MSDFRDSNDPLFGNTGYEPAERRTYAGWGWIAGAVFVVIGLAVAFGVAHEPTRVASNDTTQSAPTRMAPPATMNPSAPSVVPGLAPPPATSPAPNK